MDAGLPCLEFEAHGRIASAVGKITERPSPINQKWSTSMKFDPLATQLLPCGPCVRQAARLAMDSAIPAAINHRLWVRLPGGPAASSMAISYLCGVRRSAQKFIEQRRGYHDIHHPFINFEIRSCFGAERQQANQIARIDNPETGQRQARITQANVDSQVRRIELLLALGRVFMCMMTDMLQPKRKLVGQGQR